VMLLAVRRAVIPGVVACFEVQLTNGSRPMLLRAVRRVRAIYHLEREEYETIKKFMEPRN
jgi:hypothetical protein